MRWIILLSAGLFCAGCAGWLYDPGGPTDMAIKAGSTELSREIDLNHDGIVSSEEVVAATRKAATDRDWERLIWLGVTTVSTAMGAGVLGHKKGKTKGEAEGFKRGLYTPVPMTPAPHA